MTLSEIELFDPNGLAAPFATYCPHRRNGSDFKVHSVLGHATTAFNSHRNCVIYEYQLGFGWIEVARKDYERQAPDCEECGGHLVRHVPCTNWAGEKADYLVNNGNTVLLRTSGGKLRKPLEAKHLCSTCVRDLT